MTTRYDTAGNPEGEYQPGSDNLVLLNKLDISNVEAMELVEFDCLVQFQLQLFGELTTNQILNAADLCNWHQCWLGKIYSWAGQYRTVNMQKGDFLFATANFIPKLMDDYERDFLHKYTPCQFKTLDDLARAIAVCHIEFIVIHPFREGNGRLGRLLATVMALQADQPPLDFQILEDQGERYIGAIHAGHSGDYQPMTQLFSEIIEFTNRSIIEK